MHSTLIGMFFHKNIAVPDTLSHAGAVASFKVAGLKRGMADTKRKKYLAAKALETRKEFVKSKLAFTYRWSNGTSSNSLPLACI